MSFNLIQISIILFTVGITSTSFATVFIDPKKIPNFLHGISRYGKVVEKREYLNKHFKLPKRYFRHFYIYTAPTATMLLILVIYAYSTCYQLPEVLLLILDFALGSCRQASASPEATTLALFLVAVHTWKRLYESCFINVFSKAKMSILIYIIAFMHYTALLLSIVGESYGFVRGTQGTFNSNAHTWYYITCTIIFLIADYEQFKTNKILANLRKNKEGKVISESYKIPKGRLFEYVSSPLQLTEIVVYLMFAAILWEATTIYFITGWVVINQICNGIIQHEWYKKTFANYPENRKIIFPCLL
ncbi:polyprenol reductase-like [Chelonus insularis]|uniref:polyprenol reductase-like n=1 Tax=Chelonus insularis TaxID=460826 RepID=UPI00158F66F5|nr:polyprenol reductase-like [Chelonus insularis]